MKPFNVLVDFDTGELKPGSRVVRRLSDVRYIFQDQEAAEAMLKEGDPVVYEVIYADIPEKPGHLAHCTTILYPGKVGKEFFLTKGHLHEKLDTAEIYFCLRGEGRLIMESTEGECEILEMFPGTASYIPPFWSHRSVNVGKELLIFYCIFPADAGHDYATIEEAGFPKVILEEDGRVVVRDNPKWKPKR